MGMRSRKHRIENEQRFSFFRTLTLHVPVWPNCRDLL